MKKQALLLVGVAAVAVAVVSCGKIWEIPIPKKVVVGQIEKKFPLEKSEVFTVALSNPKVAFDGGRGKIIIDLDVKVSPPAAAGGLAQLGSALGVKTPKELGAITEPRDGKVSVESGIDYKADQKTIVLRNPEPRSIEIAGLSSDALGPIKDVIFPLIGKTLDGFGVYTFDQGSTVEKLASKHLAGFRISDDDLIIKVK